MNKVKLLIGASVILVLALFAISAVQAPEATIVVEAWSPQEIHDLGWTSHPSTGLKTVGVGELVYLFAQDAGGEEVTAVAWAINNAPDASAAVLDSADTQRTTFRADVAGAYEIQATVTTAGGASDATVTITAANYVGVGIWTDLQQDASGAACAPCHTDKVQQWVETQHPTIFKDGIDGVASSHYNEGCIECHTLGFNEEPEAVNGGFDDVATDQGWTFPEVLEEGNWDSLVTNFPDLAKLASIQCENCHGPASQHVGPPLDVTTMDVTLDEGACGRCHDEEPYHRKNIQWKRSGHSAGDVAFGAGREACAPCHSGRGFVNQVDPDVPFENGLGFAFISCAVCHDPHSEDLHAQVRNLDDVTLMNGETFTFGGASKLCMNCHLSRRDAEEYVQEYHDHYGPHHSTQADVLAGANAITFGMDIPSTNHSGVIENTCVDCHMAPTPGTDDPARDRIGEHSFAMHWDGGTPDDPTDDVDHVTPCQSCHGPITKFDDIMAKVDYDRDGAIENVRAELSGVLDMVGMLLPPLGEPEVNVIAEDYDPALPGLTPEEVAQRKLFLKAAYNYFVVEEDGSHGLHNFQYEMGLLRAAHNALTTGSLGAGMIEAIADVPNDQGKQVRVVWTRFSGDGVGDNPILSYGMWRRVDDMDVEPAFTSLEITAEELAAIEEGAFLQMEGELWDFVGRVPAAGLEKYSAIAPTLFDSTKVDGMKLSTFMVTGHTRIPAVFVASAPESGYSVDNLAPAVPGNMAGIETEAGALLTWNKALDDDFKYFAIYRSTTPGFDANALEPISTVTEPTYTDGNVMVGETYYYRLSAFDFSGNESEFTDDFSLVITSVAGEGNAQVPQSYVLEQNYPNPFNPTTNIKFGLKESGHVNMTIFNAIGEAVMTVIDDQMDAGYHNVTIGADRLSSGIYFYRISVNGFSNVKKMIIIK